MKIQLFQDLVESNGKTIKENNLEISHNVPLGTLVEVDLDYSEHHMIRAYVVRHTRDCDGSPMYALAMSNDLCRFSITGDNQLDGLIRFKMEDGFSDSCLKVIKYPETPKG